MKKGAKILYSLMLIIFLVLNGNGKINLYKNVKNKTGGNNGQFNKKIKAKRTRDISILLKRLQNDSIAGIKDGEQNLLLIGNKNGLYMSDFGESHVSNIWNDGTVKKIVKADYGYFFLTSKGIVFSGNLKDFTYKNKGIYEKSLILYKNGEKKIVKVAEELKDIKIDINNNSNLTACSKNYVYYSLNKGESWKIVKNPAWVSGIKTSNIYTDRDIFIVISHSVKGLFIKNLTRKSGWTDLLNGNVEMNTDEISDLEIKKEKNDFYLYCSFNFNPRIFRVNLTTLKWKKIIELNNDFDLIESLFFHDDSIYYSTTKGFFKCSLEEDRHQQPVNMSNLINYFNYFKNENIESVLLASDGVTNLNLNNFWLADKERKSGKEIAYNRGIYINPDNLLKDINVDKYIKLLKELRLNMIITDMKDDFGNLRFEPQGKYLTNFSFQKRTVNIDKLVSKCRENGIYLVARIVLFKDKRLYDHNGNEFALKDIFTKQGWMPYVLKDDGSYVCKSEYWVDPYSEKVWEYNIEVAKELTLRGVNEIQFDYIRFPTDGDNIDEYYSEYKIDGMNKESAIESFLNYAKENLSVPISVDIYGANGWYRSGCVTGQDVDMIKNYVDIICPMYYPSHFKDDFLNYKPFDRRPYRIYFFGSLRNYYIAQSQLVIRPWIQAFKLNVKYDNQFFNDNYILYQIKGCEDSINQGYAFWNPNGNYKYIKFLKDLNKDM